VTTTMSRPDGPQPAAGPVDAPRRPRQRQVRTLHVVFAAGLMLAGALGSTALVSLASADGAYLALATDVDYAAQISDADVVTVRVEAPPGLDPVPASEREGVIGSFAATRLHAGTLLTPQMLTANPIPGPGEHVVGITVRGDRLPAQRPRPGDTVLLVHTTDDEAAMPVARTWTATVTAVSAPGGGLLQPGRSDFVTLDVVVAVVHGPAVAQAAAANELVVVRAAGG